MTASARIPVVIGLAGGIGSGKSTVARAFEALGCVVSDSDKQAKQALDRDSVRATLSRWWGAEVLDDDGCVDRAHVARIVFEDPSQRARLEDLIHPLIREDRAALVRAAGGAPAVIVDAPLLFEVWRDAECDAVVFIEAPYADRLARVRASRVWDEAELDRRESAQWPVQRKREASQYVIENGGAFDGSGMGAETLRARAETVLETILTDADEARGTPNERGA